MENQVADYVAWNTKGGTLLISSDAAREMLPGYATPAERTANTFSRGPASSRLADAVWKQAIAGGPTPERYIVQFLTGSPGSGKSSSYLTSTEMSPLAIISEGMMDHFDKSVARIEETINAGFVPGRRCSMNSTGSATLERLVPTSTTSSVAVPVRLTPQQAAEAGDQRAHRTMVHRLARMAKGETVPEQ